MEVVETTQAGQCWRVRNPLTGNHLVPRFCATSEAQQHVDISEVVDDVKVEVHYTPAPLGAERVELLTLDQAAGGGGVAEAAVGTIQQGGTLSVAARRGQVFRAVEIGTGRELQSFAASGEAEQLVHIGAHSVDITIRYPRQPPPSGAQQRKRHIYKVWGDEHLEATVHLGAETRIKSAVGERWVVREADGDEHVLSFVAAKQQYTADHLARQQIVYLP